MWLDGFNKGRQAYRCRKCNRYMIEPSQQRKAGRPRENKQCSLCDKPHYSGGLCQAHYRAKRRSQNLDK